MRAKGLDQGAEGGGVGADPLPAVPGQVARAEVLECHYEHLHGELGGVGVFTSGA